MTRKRFAVLASALALAPCLALMGGTARADGLSDCRVAGLRHSVKCAAVQRPLDPARPEGPTIQVRYVVVPAMARRKLPDPVFLLAGGPGQSAIDLAPQTMPLFARLNNRRDIVFVDQRGTGTSAPLNCADPKREPLAEQASVGQQVRLLQQCKAELLQRPTIRTASDLGFFTTTLAMGDLDAVREQLGAKRINLVGISYGTRAALEYMRRFPQAVRRVVLDSVAPADMTLAASVSTDTQAAFDALLVACEQQAACAEAYPKLRLDWAALLAGLPKPVAVPHPLSGTLERFTLTRERVLDAARGALYSPATAAALPAAISAAVAGRYEGIVGMGSLLGARGALQLALGMHFSVVCAEDAPLLAKSTDLPGADFGNAQAELYRRVCAEWPRGVVPAAFYGVPPTRSPTLLLSGGLDPATPPRHAARIAKALGPAAQHVVVANAGHAVLGVGCARDVLYRFIDAADDRDATAVDASCLKTIPRPGVFRPIASPEGKPG